MRETSTNGPMIQNQKWRPFLKSSPSSQNQNFPSPHSFLPRPLLAVNFRSPHQEALASPARFFPFHKGLRRRSSQFQRLGRYSQFSEFRGNSACFRCGGRGHYARSCISQGRCYRCGSFGHKRSECFISSKAKIARQISLSSRSGCDEDDSWMRISFRTDSPKSLDPMLLDPNVAECLDIKSWNQMPPSDSCILSSDPSEPQLVDPQPELVYSFGDYGEPEVSLVLEQPKNPYSSNNISVSEKNLFAGQGLVSILGRRLNHGWKSRSLQSKRIGHEKLLFSRAGSFQHVKPWGLRDLLFYPGRAAEHRSQVNPSRCSLEGDDRNSDKDGNIVDKHKTAQLELPPAPYDIISSFTILDELEDYFNEVRKSPDGYLSRSYDKDIPNLVDVSSSIGKDAWPAPKNPSAPKKLQRIGSLTSIRRSPRLLRK